MMPKWDKDCGIQCAFVNTQYTVLLYLFCAYQYIMHIFCCSCLSEIDSFPAISHFFLALQYINLDSVNAN